MVRRWLESGLLEGLRRGRRIGKLIFALPKEEPWNAFFYERECVKDAGEHSTQASANFTCKSTVRAECRRHGCRRQWHRDALMRCPVPYKRN